MSLQEGRSATGASTGSLFKPYAPRVFISASSGDLGSYRRLVRDELLTGGCLPVLQEHFPSDPRSLSAFLEDAIRKCDAVICLLGPRFGAAPEAIGSEFRSYTQMEYDVARRLNKDIYVFLASPSCPLDDQSGETEDKSRLQQEHIHAIKKRHQAICKLFSSQEELRAHILRLLPGFAKGRQEKYWLQSPPPYAYFAGRQAELRQLTDATTGKGPCVVGVLGPPGQGKTTLLWEWFVHHCPEVFAAGFWCPAENENTFEVFLDGALGYLQGGTYDKRSLPDVRDRVHVLIQFLRDRPCLLLVDGLEKWLKAWADRGTLSGQASDADCARGTQEGLDFFLSQVSVVTGGSHFVFTSRALPAALESAPHAEIPVLNELVQARLQGLDDTAAIALLRKFNAKGTDAELLAVANDFEKHPLSLTILGKLASRRNYGGSVAGFRAHNRLIREDDRLVSLLNGLQNTLPHKEGSAHLMDVLAHFREIPSYEQFRGFLRWLVFAQDHSSLVVCPTLHLDDDALRDGLATLDDWSLVTWDRHGNSIHLHPMLREHFCDASKNSNRIHAALAAWYLTQPVAPGARTLREISTRVLTIEHALLGSARSLCDTAVLTAVSQCSSLPEWMALWGHQSAGIDLLTRVFALSSEPERSKHLISRGAMRQDLGHLSLARQDLTDAIRWLDGRFWRRRKYREELAGAYMNRGSACADSGTPNQAVRDLDTALHILTWPFGLRHHDGAMMGDIFTNRGSAHRDLGNLSRAEQDATRALVTYRRCEGSTSAQTCRIHRQTATVLLNRGNARANARRYDSADDDYRAAIQEIVHMRDEDGGRTSALRALIHIARGLLLHDTDKWSMALTEYDAAIAAVSELVRQGSLDVRITLGLAYSNRAITHIGQGNLQQAAEDVDAAMRLYNQTGWEVSSRLAVWVAANLTALAGLGRILTKDIAMHQVNTNTFESWRTLSCTQGKHVLAPFVRANTGIARLLFRYDPQFSAHAVRSVLAVIEDGVTDGYWSEWLIWEVNDLHEFVAAHGDDLSALGVPIERVSAVRTVLLSQAMKRTGGIHVPI